MPDSLKKVFAITGASDGLGKCLGLEAGTRGARVALLARRGNLLRQLAKQIHSSGGEAHAVPVDITDPAAVQSAFSDIKRIWGRVDILINCAGVLEPLSPLVSCSDLELLNSLKTNVFGIYLTTQQALRIMTKQSTGGSVVNITGGTAIHPYAGLSAYCSQKAAINMFTQCVAMEVAERPIRVVAICPGSFDSHMQQAIRAADDSQFPSRSRFVRFYEDGKLADPKELARVIVDIAVSDWPELSGRIEDLRSVTFREECCKRGIIFHRDWA